MEPGDYYGKKLPSTLYTRVERFFWFNWKWLAIAAVLAFYFLFPLVYDEPIDEPPVQYDLTSR